MLALCLQAGSIYLSCHVCGSFISYHVSRSPLVATSRLRSLWSGWEDACRKLTSICLVQSLPCFRHLFLSARTFAVIDNPRVENKR